MTVTRFSVYKCHFREDVAQHSYLTTLYAMILADLERLDGRKVDVERLLRMALLHDAEESRTGDIQLGNQIYQVTSQSSSILE